MQSVKKIKLSAFCLMLAVALFSCKKKDEDTKTGVDSSLPAVYQKFTNVEAVYQDGDFLVVESKGIKLVMPGRSNHLYLVG